MAAILDSLGFTFLIDRMTEVLTPDIYIELTVASMLNFHNQIDNHHSDANDRQIYFE